MRSSTDATASLRARRRGVGARARGFSLLEVLVAFVILALVGTALFRLFGDVLHNVGAADEYSRAVLVGESVLAAAAGAVPLRDASTNGDADDGRIQWKAETRPYVAPQAANNEIDHSTDAMTLRLWRIAVEVTFPAVDGRPRTIALSSVRLGTRDAK